MKFIYMFITIGMLSALLVMLRIGFHDIVSDSAIAFINSIKSSRLFYKLRSPGNERVLAYFPREQTQFMGEIVYV